MAFSWRPSRSRRRDASRLGGLGHRQSFLVAVGVVLVVAMGVVLALGLRETGTASAFFFGFASDFERFNFLAIRSSMQKRPMNA